MKPEPLLDRDSFREGVFARDGHKCVFCGETSNLDAHHIVERRLFSEPHEKGGYFLSNGASVCSVHHLACERTTLSCDEVREAAGIERTVLPAHLYADQAYTKWGDPVMPSGQRIRGELFWDESVQKALAEGRVLDRYTHIVRAPRTYHLPWSAGMNDDDRMMPDVSSMEDQDCVVMDKMDGESNSVYTRHFHARAPDGRRKPWQGPVRAEVAEWQYNIPDEWRVVGEGLYARHSIAYESLPCWFMGFQVWNERNVCLSWDDTIEWFELIGVTPVPVLYRGPFDRRLIETMYDEKKDRDTREGYVVRLARAFEYREYPRAVGKYVRQGHNQTVKHGWGTQVIEPNGMATGS